MHHKLAMVSNVRLLESAYAGLIHRPAGTPGIGLIHGFTGAGKTTTVVNRIVSENAVYVRFQSLWTATDMCRALCAELGLLPSHRSGEMMDRVIKCLQSTKKAIFFDEADYLITNKRLLEAVRDLHDESDAPIILIGMEGIDVKIQRHRQFSRRISQWVRFQPMNASDLSVLIKTCCEIEIAPCLQEFILKECKGSIGLAIVGLPQIEAYGMGLDHPLTLDEWKMAGTPLFLGAKIL